MDDDMREKAFSRLVEIHNKNEHTEGFMQ